MGTRVLNLILLIIYLKLRAAGVRKSEIAQLVEYMTADLKFAGSSPARNLLTKQEDNTAVHITVNLEQKFYF